MGFYEARLTAYEAALPAMKHFAASAAKYEAKPYGFMFFAHSGKKMEPMIGIDKEGTARRSAFAQAEATDG